MAVYDFCILGAGIAGLSLADALQNRGYSAIILEQDAIASGASGTPGGLVNPATGRRAKKVWNAEACYRAIRKNLQKIASFSSATFYQKNGLLRPALSEKMARKMRRQFDQTLWPEGWCQWLTEKQIKKRHPGINCAVGGLWLPVGLTVDVKAYLKAYAQYLQTLDITIHTGCEASFQRGGESWAIRTSTHKITSNHLVFATGLSAVDHPYWFHLPLEGVKGQVVKFRTPKPLTFDYSISSLGYIVRLGNKYEFVQGSTYEHDFMHLKPDADGEQYLRKRLARTLPQLAEQAELVDQWAGVRVSTPDKMPVVGSHPELQKLHIFTALGSKGLMYGKFLADHYADHLKNGTPLFPEVVANRFKPDYPQ